MISPGPRLNIGCLPNDLAFSGEHPPERSEEGRSSAATPLWVDCSILDTPRQLGMIEAGHAPAGYEPATREHVMLTNSASSPRVCLCP